MLLTGTSGAGKDVVATCYARAIPSADKPAVIRSKPQRSPTELADGPSSSAKQGAFTGEKSDKLGSLNSRRGWHVCSSRGRRVQLGSRQSAPLRLQSGEVQPGAAGPSGVDSA